MTEARVSGDHALADMLADATAKCLMKIAEVPPTPPPVPEPQQPAAQQQQQVQPKEEEELRRSLSRVLGIQKRGGGR